MKGYRRKNTIQDVWKWVEKRGPDECWPWTSSRNLMGYGTFKIECRSLGAHRVVYEAATGVAPGDLFVCHRCDNPGCCNPAHLFLGTPLQNMQDKISKGRGVTVRGVSHPFAKLTDAQVVEIRARRSNGEQGRVLAAEFGVSESTLSNIVKHKRWKHVGVAA